MLTGSQLIQLVKSNPDLNRSQLAKKAGYVRTTDEGKEQILVQRFYDALLTAQGMPIKKGKTGAGGKTAQYETSVHKSGILLVGKTYTAEAGFEPGDVFGIEVRDDGIWLQLKERDVAARKDTTAKSETAAAAAKSEKVAVAA
jgi:hypothetical protein